MLLAAWENEQALIEKKEKEVSSLARAGLGGAWGGKAKWQGKASSLDGQCLTYSSYKGEPMHSEALSGSSSMEGHLGSQHWKNNPSYTSESAICLDPSSRDNFPAADTASVKRNCLWSRSGEPPLKIWSRK